MIIIQYLMKRLTRSVYFDVGANLGYYTTLLSPFVKRIVAFEPVTTSCRYCQTNVALNQRDVVLHGIGLWHREAVSRWPSIARATAAHVGSGDAVHCITLGQLDVRPRRQDRHRGSRHSRCRACGRWNAHVPWWSWAQSTGAGSAALKRETWRFAGLIARTRPFSELRPSTVDTWSPHRPRPRQPVNIVAMPAHRELVARAGQSFRVKRRRSSESKDGSRDAALMFMATTRSPRRRHRRRCSGDWRSPWPLGDWLSAMRDDGARSWRSASSSSSNTEHPGSGQAAAAV